MLYVCVRDIMDIEFSVCIVTRGAVGARFTVCARILPYRKYERFVMQIWYVCVVCASCGSSQC